MNTFTYFSPSFSLVITTILSILFSPASSTLLPGSTESPSAPGPALPFNFTYLFTAQLNLGLPSKPITIPGGVRIVEPILNGTVFGPGINATIDYSLATPTVVNNGTIQRAVIDAVGTTDDGFSLYLHETGIGSPTAQITRIELEIGDGGSKYAALQNGYILAAVNPSADQKTVTVLGYLVDNQVGPT